ncbi:MAG: hypothetical protein EA361_12965 [Bacteroidetes bacterium]|nr:MAG: hypothetical protein EA361_12965 [Bacteroidota bacterium]
MKKFKILTVVVLSGFLLLQACDDDLFDVSETFTFEHEFVVYSEETSAELTSLVNLSQEQDLINQYGSKIKSIEVQGVKYWLKSFTGSEEQMMNTLQLQVANPDGSDAKTMVQLENIALHQLLNSPVDLPINTEGVSKLEDLVEVAPHSLMYFLDVSINEVPADFTIVFEITAKMTANPLN